MKHEIKKSKVGDVRSSLLELLAIKFFIGSEENYIDFPMEIVFEYTMEDDIFEDMGFEFHLGMDSPGNKKALTAFFLQLEAQYGERFDGELFTKLADPESKIFSKPKV